MKITIESTNKVIMLNGQPARIWEGETVNGVKVICYMSLISHHKKEAPEKIRSFKAQLKQVKAPSADAAAIPLRLII